MIKFTSIKDEEGNTFTATGTHYQRGQPYNYKITGKRNPPSEDGRILVELKLTYTTVEDDLELNGVFDPEENSLRGTTVFLPDRSTGQFVFKRDPDLVRFYPPPSTINARKRWEFATRSVLDGIRRKVWSPAYILKRIKDRRRYMELCLRLYYGRYPNDDELAELSSLFSVLYEADVRFYASLIRINLNETPVL